MSKFAAFDLEIAREFPDSGSWRAAAPLGITCAALALSDEAEPHLFHSAPQLSVDASAALVHELESVVAAGYTLVTWNGTAFDFAVLAQESALPTDCARLALDHVDLMVIVTFRKGHYLGLQRALLGAGLAGKRTEVNLKDGSRLLEMSGKLAPQLWARGEYDAVLSYLREDVVPLLQLVAYVESQKQIRWTSRQGNLCVLNVPRLYTVRECFQFPLPDTSWMTTPPPERSRFVEWMPPLDAIIPRQPYAPHELRELPLFSYAAEDEYWREFRRLLAASPPKL